LVSLPSRRDARVKPVHDEAEAVQRVLPGLEPGIQEPRSGDEISLTFVAYLFAIAPDARVKPVHDDAEAVQRVLPGLEPGIQDARSGDEISLTIVAYLVAIVAGCTGQARA
jgi:hypothetical protein